MFENQDRANQYAASIDDSTDRVFVQAGLARAIGLLVRDEEYRRTSSSKPFDLYLYARALHAMVNDKRLLTAVLSGQYHDFNDIPDLF